MWFSDQQKSWSVPLILKIVLHIAIDAQHAARPQLHNIQILAMNNSVGVKI